MFPLAGVRLLSLHCLQVKDELAAAIDGAAPTELVGEFIEETFVTGEFFFCKISCVAILPTHCCSVAVRAPFVPDQSAAYHL